MSAHGYAAYTNGCRCNTCRSAKASYMREKRAAARAYVAEAADAARAFVDIPTHGIAGYQDHMCRCGVCTTAKAAARKRESRCQQVLA